MKVLFCDISINKYSMGWEKVANLIVNYIHGVLLNILTSDYYLSYDILMVNVN